MSEQPATIELKVDKVSQLFDTLARMEIASR